MAQDKSKLGLFMAHRGELVDYASAIVGSRAGAEDVVQEAWLRFSHATAGRLLEHPLGYLYRIVRNIALDWRRKMAREGRYLVNTQDNAVDQQPTGGPSPEARSLRREQVALVRAALEGLPERTRVALRMYRLEGRKLKEVAAHLGISVTLAHYIITDGIRHCQRQLRRRS
ncbi:MAG: sigma-70 family RNA polymerase sigma factor [Reyranella sp.]|nr:sigma-70 family RNA polymerase sigma factor [Reyranella sp.]